MSDFPEHAKDYRKWPLDDLFALVKRYAPELADCSKREVFLHAYGVKKTADEAYKLAERREGKEDGGLREFLIMRYEKYALKALTKTASDE